MGRVEERYLHRVVERFQEEIEEMNKLLPAKFQFYNSISALFK